MSSPTAKTRGVPTISPRRGGARQDGTRALGRGNQSAALLRCGAGSSVGPVLAAGRRGIAVIVVLLLATITLPVLADHAAGHAAESKLPRTPPDALDVLEALGVAPSPPTDGGGFLDPDAAFALSAAARDPLTVLIRWKLADTYYLYRDRFSFTISPPVIALGEPRLPPGTLKQDPNFGAVEVYYDGVEILLPLQRRERNAAEVTLEVGYQGCTDRGLCYPPMKKSVTLALPAWR